MDEYLKQGIPPIVIEEMKAFAEKHQLKHGTDIVVLKRDTGEAFIHLKRNGIRKILDKNGMTLLDTFFVYVGDRVVYKKGKIESIEKGYSSDTILAVVGVMEIGKKYFCIELRSRDYYAGTKLWQKCPGVLLTRICEAALAKKAFPEIFEDIITVDYVPEDIADDEIEMTREEMIEYIKSEPDKAAKAMSDLSYDVSVTSLSALKLKNVINKMKEEE